MSRSNLGPLDVSRETIERLDVFVALLIKWNPKINLVSKRSLDDLWNRHFVDSAQLFDLMPESGPWLDIGSGGGFPGLVVAILKANQKNTQPVTLIESDQRKGAFLRTVARETGVACTVLSKRIETVEPQNAQVLSARALAELPELLQFAERHLASDGTALFPKGANWKKEVERARAQWSFDLVPITSWTEPEAAILQIKGVSRV